MDSADNSNKYTTTPIRSDDSQNSTSRRQMFDRNTYQYKTPVRCNESVMKRGKVQFKNSTFKKMPIYSPPTDVSGHIKNPFEHAKFLKERLSQPICSPSLFERRSPKNDEQFSWSIEDISILRPAPIDENPVQEFDSWFSPATENEAQKAINQFFSSHIVSMESPVNIRQSRFNILENKERTESWTQTILTFPPNLPPEVEKILATYCTFNEDKLSEDEQEEMDDVDLDSSTCSVSRKKLSFDEVTDDELACNTPLQLKKTFNQQNVASTPITKMLSSPELSPIVNDKMQGSPMDMSISFRSKTRLSLMGDDQMTDKENMSWNCQSQSPDGGFSST